MQENRDTFTSKEVSLAQLVSMCEDCESLCRERTQRVVVNRSRAPRGWEKEYDDVAKGVRDGELSKCLGSCQLVHQRCPSASALERLSPNKQESEESASRYLGWFSRRKETPKPTESPVITQNEISICENAAFDFSKVLFMLAHKPTKVHFDSFDPKTGDKFNPETGEWLTKNEKTMSSKEINEMIHDRWSGNTKKDIEKLRGELHEIPQQSSASHGTVPKWK